MAAQANTGPTLFLTGGQGFVGTALRRLIAERHPGWKLIAPAGPGEGAADDDEHCLDVTDPENLDAWIEFVRPDMVVHLAGIAAVSVSNRDPRLAWRVNLDGTLNLVLALQRHTPSAYLLHMSSADVYGASAAHGHLTEQALLQPLNPYAASKAAADLLVRQAAAQGLRATVMRSFNQIGPGQSQDFALPNFAAQIARIEAECQEPVLRVGALTDRRDFVDVLDSTGAYLLALERRAALGNGEVFNICSGIGREIGEVLNQMIALSACDITVEVDPSRLRPAPSPMVVGDPSLAGQRLGWAATRGVAGALQAILDECRSGMRSTG